MSAAVQTDTVAEPNLVPMLDMVFQLITFFMLVINMKNASIDEKLKLPIIGSARTVDTKGTEDFVILNINEKGELIVYNAKREDWQRYIAVQAQASLRMAKEKNPKFTAGEELPTTIVIRGSQKLPYGKLHPFITECQKHKFLKFQFRALNKAPEGT
jgi:biopolymer transport protein ExbD